MPLMQPEWGRAGQVGTQHLCGRGIAQLHQAPETELKPNQSEKVRRHIKPSLPGTSTSHGNTYDDGTSTGSGSTFHPINHFSTT